MVLLKLPKCNSLHHRVIQGGCCSGHVIQP